MKKCAKCEGKLIEGLKYCFTCGADVAPNKKQEKDNKVKKVTKSRLDTRLFEII